MCTIARWIPKNIFFFLLLITKHSHRFSFFFKFATIAMRIYQICSIWDYVYSRILTEDKYLYRLLSTVGTNRIRILPRRDLHSYKQWFCKPLNAITLFLVVFVGVTLPNSSRAASECNGIEDLWVDTCLVDVNEGGRGRLGGGSINSKSDSSESDVEAIVTLTWVVECVSAMMLVDRDC